MRTLMIILALTIGTMMGANAQNQTTPKTQAKPQTTTQPATQSHPMSASAEQSRTMVKVADLPRTIQNNLSSQFKGWTASKAERLDTKGIITYEVTARNGSNEMNLIYDKDGKYLRQEPVSAMTSHNSKSSTSMKPAAKSTSTTKTSTGKHN